MVKKKKVFERTDAPEYVGTQSGEVFTNDADRLFEGDPRRRYEYPDSTPMAPPIGYNPQPSMFEQMRAMQEAQRSMLLAGQDETFEEADDFDIEDDPADPSTPYEEFFLGSVGSLSPDFPAAVAKLQADLAAAQAAANPPPSPPPAETAPKTPSDPSRAAEGRSSGPLTAPDPK